MNRRETAAVGHPRLHFAAGDIPALREKVAEGVPAWLYSQLLANCELATMVTWDTWYAGYEPTRGGMIAAASEAYDWLHPRLDRGQREEARAKIARETRILREHIVEEISPERHDSAPPRTYGPLGTAGLLLLGEDPEAQEWIDTAFGGLNGWLGGALDDDGAPYYSSDSCYFTIAMSYLLCFSFAARQVVGQDLFDHPKFRKNVHYLLYRMEPQRDGHNQFCVYNRLPLAVNHPIGLAAAYGDGLAQWHYLHTQGRGS